jgi:hypothetical protein
MHKNALQDAVHMSIADVIIPYTLEKSSLSIIGK